MTVEKLQHVGALSMQVLTFFLEQSNCAFSWINKTLARSCQLEQGLHE
jgi:hypothetical protein